MQKLLLLLFLPLWLIGQNSSPKADIIKNIVGYEEKGQYCGWPNIVEADNGDILVGFCRAEEHHSPTGEMVLIKSTNRGITWSKPEVIFDTPLDDRHAAFLKLKDGRIIMFLGSS